MTKIFAVLTSFLFTLIASAQHSSQKATIGIKGGINLYNIDLPDNGGAAFHNKIGFNAGLLAHIHLIPRLALQPEIVYSVQGTKGDGTVAKFNNNLNYLNVPVLLQFMFDNGFRLQAGPQVGFLLNAKQKIGGFPAT